MNLGKDEKRPKGQGDALKPTPRGERPCVRMHAWLEGIQSAHRAIGAMQRPIRYACSADLGAPSATRRGGQ